MLKFSDLSVDFKSYDNSFDSLMKLIPGSYYPLLIMYLAHNNKIAYKMDYEENDPRILVSVDGGTLKEFFGDNLMDKVFRKVPGFDEESDFETALQRFNDSLFKDRDSYVMTPFIYLMSPIDEGNSVALVANVPEDDQILDLIKLLGIQSSDPNISAAMLFFSMMLDSKYREIADSGESLSEEEKSDKRRLRHSIWVEDFEEAMNKIVSYSGNTSFSQPKELSRLMLTMYTGGSIYNPFAGIASYNIQRYYECCISDFFYPVRSLGDFYYGEEINPQTWALGKLRLLAFNCDSANYILSDSSEWRDGEIDNIFCTPPFGYKFENEFGKKEYADHFVIRRGLDMIAEDGLLACVVPQSFMTRKDTEDIRKRIIKDGLLESVVYLPENIINGSSFRSAVLFIRKTTHSSVAFINATNAVSHKRGKLNILDVEFVANLLCHEHYTTNYSFDSVGDMSEKLSEDTYYKLRVSVSTEKLEKNKFDLTPGRYLLSNLIPLEGFTYKVMGDLVKGVTKTTKDAGRGKLIRPEFLSKDGFTPLSSVSLQEDDYKKGYSVVEGNALLFSPLASMRPTLLLNPTGEKLYYKADTLHAVYFKEGAVLPEYLVLELCKSYIQEQIMVLANGDIIPKLGLSEFECLRVAIPSTASQALEVENKLVEDQKNLHFSKVNAELAALKDRQHDDYVKMLRQRKHRLQQIMNEFTPAFSMLNQLRKENGGVLHDSDIVAARTGKVVGEYFDRLESIVIKLEDLVTNLIDKEMWKEPKPVDLVQFINSIPKSHISDRFVFQIEDNYCPGLTSNGILPYYSSSEVLIAPDDLSTVFDNIINNAIKYGFTDSIRKDYAIRIYLLSDVTDNIPCVNIYVSNNGNPIHPSLDRKRFFDWGYGTNTGIGTWQIKSIVEHYGGQVSLNENPDEVAGFQTELIISLPLIDKEIWR